MTHFQLEFGNVEVKVGAHEEFAVHRNARVVIFHHLSVLLEYKASFFFQEFGLVHYFQNIKLRKFLQLLLDGWLLCLCILGVFFIFFLNFSDYVSIAKQRRFYQSYWFKNEINCFERNI